jgi:hypothetical protein
VWVSGGILLVAAVAAGLWRVAAPSARPRPTRAEVQAAGIRAFLFDLLQPVVLSNCRLERFGEPHDGGYLLCGNLLGNVAAGYSYGISGYDGWGCQVATTLGIPVHQYDCFDTRQPACDAATTFHAECIGVESGSIDGRAFDTIEHQLQKNGHGTSSVVVKMDVEGAEWDSLLEAPDAVLERVDQLAIELHGVNEVRFVSVVQRLRRFFHVANVHMNNFSCAADVSPFPAFAYEVLFVSKRLGQVDATAPPPPMPHPLDSPNIPDRPDCQVARRP